ncbi:MAG: Mss4p nuclear export [Lichina confinis]|nr:MAG: Mss4p nuclear export [Lichina confinis]
MAKRKHTTANNGAEELSNGEEERASAQGDDPTDDELDTLEAEFEWFDPQPDNDFHGLKALLRQLFDVDAHMLDLSALTDLILSQPLLGSTVKVEGNESDPFAFLTVLNLREHQDKAVIRDLQAYLARKCASVPSMARLAQLMSASPTAATGLILTERLVNVPPEVVPPMYTMLLEEMQWARDEKEPYEFSSYVIISKVYAEVESSADLQQGRPSKKKRSKGSGGDSGSFYFHPEDEVLHKHAAEHGSYGFSRQDVDGNPDSKRAFQELGIRPQGHIMMIEGSKFESAVKAMAAAFGSA